MSMQLVPEQLEIIHYPHPTLRHLSKPVVRVDATLKQVIQQMFVLMYEARGIGLATNQVNLPLRFFVVNLAADPDEGEEMVFINPVISRPKGHEEHEEGCLSMPGVNADVKRPEQIHVQAYDLAGNLFDQTVDGMLSRVIQHETDHLDGVLFTDKLTDTKTMAVADELYELEVAFESAQGTGSIPDNAAIQEWIAAIEKTYA